MRRSQHLGRIITMTTVAAVVAGACSSSKSTPTGAGSPASSPAVAIVTTTSSSAPKLPSGPPIKVGYINNEGAVALSVPELRLGAQVGADYVNGTLDGVANAPIHIIPCVDDGSPEKAIDCANQLVEQKVVAVMVGQDTGADAVVPILKSAGVPLVGHIQSGVAQMFDANSFFFGAAAFSYAADAVKFYAGQGAKSIEWFIPDQPTYHQLSDLLVTPAAKAAGVAYKSVYYDATNPDWSVLGATAVADHPDVSGSLLGTDGVCAAFIGALRDAGYQGHILAASCNGLFKADGGKAIGVDVDSDHWNPSDPNSAPAAKQTDIQTFTAAMKAAGHADLVRGNAIIGFADVVDLAKVMGTVSGPVTGAALITALQATKGLDSFDGPAITCDHTLIKGNSACSTGLLFYRIQSDGSPKAVTTDFVG